MNPVSRTTGEGRAEFLRTWGPVFDKEGAGAGGAGGRGVLEGGAAQFVLGNYKPHPGSRTNSEERPEHSRGWGWREGGGRLQQRHGWLLKDNEVISSAWKCLLLRQISMLGEVFEQEGAGEI